MLSSKKGEFHLKGMIIAILIVGLFVGVFSAIIVLQSNVYDISGYDDEKLGQFNAMQNMSSDLQSVYAQTDLVTAESSWYDYFSGMWSKLTQPFKIVYRSFAYIISMINTASEVFALLPIFKDFFTALIITLVIVGIVLVKFYLGRDK